MNNRRGDDLRSIGGFVARGRTCLAKLSGVSSTTSGRPTAAPPIARAGRVASPAIASPEAAASPARRLTATSPFATSAFAWARAVTAGRASRVAETRSLDRPPEGHAACGDGCERGRGDDAHPRRPGSARPSLSMARPDLVEKRHPSLGMWIIYSRDLNSPAPQWIILLEIANYGPITVHRQSTHTVHAPLAIRANFPSTAAEVSLENLLWDFPVPA